MVVDGPSYAVASMRKTLSVAASLVTLLIVALPRPASAATWTNGIDVSHWQGNINWSQVATTDVRFAIAKATEGQTFVDSEYADNKAGATANGIKFTGYHFARPDTTSGDARKEANHFVRTARLGPGNLIPALDLEVNGGLSVSALQSWVRQWLNRVSRSVGVKPMIYTSPSFWQTSMGDTTEFAERGYKVLWIAHWTSATGPTVPARNWGGHGWTFWQYTNCRSVAGISGCVDGDRYNGTDFARVTI